MNKFSNFFNKGHKSQGSHGHASPAPQENRISTSSETHYEDGVAVTVTTTTKTVNGVTTVTKTTTRGGKPPTKQELQQQLEAQIRQEQEQNPGQKIQWQTSQQPPEPQQPALEDKMRELNIQRETRPEPQQETRPEPQRASSVHQPAQLPRHFVSSMQAEEVHPDLHAKRAVDGGVKMPLHRLIGQDVEDIIEVLEKRSIIVAPGYKAPLKLEEIDFEKVDHHARNAPQSVTSTIGGLSNYLTSPFKGNELFMHRAIFTWIAENLIYDANTFLKRVDTPQDAETALRTRSAVCAGYSNLYVALAEPAGLKASIVHGYGRGYGSSPKDRNVERDSHTGKPTGHAWNSIEVQGNIFLVDSTWGSGHLDPSGRFVRGFNPFYFAMKPKVAIYSHLPGDENKQFISPPFTVEEFLELPYVKGPYFRNRLNIISPKPRSGEIHTQDGIVDVYVEAENVEEDESIFAHIVFEGHPIIDALSQQVGGFGPGRKVWWIHAVCPKNGDGKLELFLVKGDNPGPNTITYHVHNSGPGQDVKLTTRFASNLKYAILHPIHHPKPSETPVRIEMMIFNPDQAPDNLIVMHVGSHGKGRMNLPKVAILDGEVALYEAHLTFNEKGDWDIYYDEDGNGSLSGLAKIIVA